MTDSVYMARALPLPSMGYAETIKKARSIYHQLERRTKRRPYVRSAFFGKRKIFLDLFWKHLDPPSRSTPGLPGGEEQHPLRRMSPHRGVGDGTTGLPVGLDQKPQSERRRRLRFLPCGFELFEQSRSQPISRANPNKKTDVVHRFFGATRSHEPFAVQVRESGTPPTLWLMSIFPTDQKISRK